VLARSIKEENSLVPLKHTNAIFIFRCKTLKFAVRFRFRFIASKIDPKIRLYLKSWVPSFVVVSREYARLSWRKVGINRKKKKKRSWKKLQGKPKKIMKILRCNPITSHQTIQE